MTRIRTPRKRIRQRTARELMLGKPAMSIRGLGIGPRIGFALRRLAWRLCGADRLYDSAADFLEQISRRCRQIGVADTFGQFENDVRAAAERMTTDLNWFDPRWTIDKDPAELPPGVKVWKP